MTLAFVVPTARMPSGGHAYNAQVLRHWPGEGPVVVELDAAWPDGDQAAVAALRDAVFAHEVTVVDGLVGAAHPEVFAAAATAGRRTVLLVHLPLPEEGGLPLARRTILSARERRSVEEAWRVVATSNAAAVDLADRYGRTDVIAVPPGADPAPIAAVHRPPHFIQVAAIGARKNQATTLAALSRLTDLDWTATLIGPIAEPGYAERIRSSAQKSGRVRVAGPLRGADLAAAYAGADLLVHPATYETFGMVVTEALARAIPAIVGAGTGAVEALASGSDSDVLPGTAVDPADPDALAAALRRWLTDPELRLSWRRRALAARPQLRIWPQVAAELAAAVSP